VIQDLTRVFFYLIEGTERAVLIDTGSGVGDLSSFVSTLTNKPIDVLLTHGHLDHAGGMFGFDEKQVYIHSADMEMVTGADNSELSRKNFVTMMNGGICPCPENAIVKSRPMKTKTFGKDDTIELGGRTLEVIEVPGHTQGSVVFLDRHNRILFSGDAANQSTFLHLPTSSTVETYLKSLKKLHKYCDYYDIYMIAHVAPVAKKEIVSDLIEICEEILDGSTQGEPFAWSINPYGDALLAKPANNKDFSRTDGKMGNLVYRPSRIRN
jgi:glyoxylase-like metal-dependent hydrolase (beta-lactamase superfamily II)